MYKIKEHAEDFFVREVTSLSFRKTGNYLICLLRKKNYTTIRAVEQISKVIGLRLKDIGFAGIKDKNAVTEQYISLKGMSEENIDDMGLKDIDLRSFGYLDKPISLGDLKGNEFEIIVRDFDGGIKKNRRMPNFFGEQRFSRYNSDIGRELVKGNFKKALELILKTDIDYEKEIKEFMKDRGNDFIGAIRFIPKKLLKLYVHAYQSYLWNLSLKDYLDLSIKKNIKIPLVGFGTEIEDKQIGGIVGKIMDKEGIDFRSFINRSIPELSLEGDYRDAFTEINELRILENGDDSIKLSFFLEKGSYATVAIDFLLT